jgi:WD40 repeat protein
MNPLTRTFQLLLFLFASCIISTAQTIETVVQTGHYAEVTAVTCSPDGKLIATGSRDKTIKLWRSIDGKEIRTFTGSNSPITGIKFNRQGTSILSVNTEGEVLISNITTGESTRRISIGKDKLTCADFSPDGTQLVTGSKESYVSIWDLTTGSEIKKMKAIPSELLTDKAFNYSGGKSVSFSADGKYILGGTGDKTAIVWDAISGKELAKYKKSNYTCTSCLVEAIFSTDSRYLFVACDDSIKVFDRTSGVLIKELYHKGGDLSSLTLSNDNQYLAAVEYGHIVVWSLKTSHAIFETDDNSNRNLAVCFSPDGKYLITGNEKRVAEVWNFSKSKKTNTLKGYLNQIDERLLENSYMYWASMVNEAKLSPDGKYIAVGRVGNSARLIDFKTGRVHKTLTGHRNMVISLNFSNDGKYLATGGLDGRAIVWDTETGKPYRTFQYPDSSMAIFSLDISPDNHYLATADWAGYVVIWDLETGEYKKSLYPHEGKASYHVKFSSNGIYIISAGLDRKLKMIEIDTGEEFRTFKGHTDLVTSIDMNTHGDKIITASLDKTIRVWDYTSGLQLQKIIAHKRGVYAAKFDLSGKYIISGGDDNFVKLWDASTGALISEFLGHQGGVGDVNMSPDQKHIISGSRDGSIRIWNVETHKELLSMAFLNQNDWFMKTPEGYFDASEGAYKSISFVKGTDLYAIDQFFNEFYRPGLYEQVVFNKDIGFRDNILHKIDTYPPPKLEIVLPDSTFSPDNDMATIMVKITNNGGGVKEFKVMQNGKRQIIDDSDLRRMKKAGQYTMKTFDLAMVPGENEISISAFSDGEIESVPVSTTIKYKGIQKQSDCYVVSVGINKYENESLNLNFARNDAQSFHNLMVSRATIFKHTFPYVLLDKNATKDKILVTLDEIAKVIKKEDVFVFFYAGHGSTVDNLFYFIPTEGTGLYQQDKLFRAISVKELQDKFKQIAALKQVVFIDACQSGTSLELLAARGAGEEKALAQLSRSSGIHILASSESNQESAEIKKLEHGVFTYTLLEALQGKADGAPKDSKITVYEVKSYIDDQVPEISYRLIRHKQFPSTFSIGHDFPLVVE